MVVGSLAAFQVPAFAGTSNAVSHAKSGKPVKAVSPPDKVAVALEKTQGARYLTLTEATEGGALRYEIDSRHVKAESWIGGKVSLIQIGSEVYAPATKRSCYDSAKRTTALLPNIAGTLLPSGIAALHYSVKGKTIHWTIKSTAKYQPHGFVKVNAAGRIVSATVYSGPGVPLTATVSYPAKAPKIGAPKLICSK
jgi:hypothetical protein